MAKIEKTPAEWAKWIDEMYASAPNPAAIPDLVQGVIESARDVGHDEGIEVFAVYLEKLAAEYSGVEPAVVDGQLMCDWLRVHVEHARTLKKGGA